MGKFEVFQSKGQWYFRLKAGNGEIIAASQGYNTKQGAMKGVASVQANAGKADILIIDKDKVETNKRGLRKQLDKQERDYSNPKKTDMIKSEEEKEDEKKVLTSPPISSWKHVGPRWM